MATVSVWFALPRAWSLLIRLAWQARGPLSPHAGLINTQRHAWILFVSNMGPRDQTQVLMLARQAFTDRDVSRAQATVAVGWGCGLVGGTCLACMKSRVCSSALRKL